MKTRPAPARTTGTATVAIVVARWNREITEVLGAGAEQVARDAGMTVERFGVAGAFELPAAVATLARSGRFDAIVPIGCLVRGDTPHFDVLSRVVAAGLMDLSLTYECAIPFGVLTCDTFDQARERAGGKEGNKGQEAMEAAFDLLALRKLARRPAAARAAPAARKRRSPR